MATHAESICRKQQSNNLKKVKGIKFPNVKFDMVISFDLQGKYDINEPECWFLKKAKRGMKSVKSPGRIIMGSGFSFLDGLRDIHFMGSREQMQETADLFAQSPFRIAKINISIRDED
jgi:hypothetical protein